jgi:hypothetical protein
MYVFYYDFPVYIHVGNEKDNDFVSYADSTWMVPGTVTPN